MAWNREIQTIRYGKSIERNQKNLRKMTLTDKEKIKEVLGILEIKIKDYEDEHKEFFDSMQYAEASRFKHMKELLEEIKKILEK